jgi:hypothetical protein
MGYVSILGQSNLGMSHQLGAGQCQSLGMECKYILNNQQQAVEEVALLVPSNSLISLQQVPVLWYLGPQPSASVPIPLSFSLQCLRNHR